MSGAELHMIQLRLDAAALGRLHVQAGLPPHHQDIGYLTHSLLASLFAGTAVQPFALQDETRRQLEVLGYSVSTAQELRGRADTFATPEAHQACDWASFASKPMPKAWEPGRRLGFAVRICPTVRIASAAEVLGKNGEAQALAAGTELDAWLHRRFLKEEAVDREEVYVSWLAGRVRPAAELIEARLHSFRRLRLVRRTRGQKRAAHVLERPDVLVRGTLAVLDSEAFIRLLGRGVGRHRSFGFGMLLLRPAD